MELMDFKEVNFVFLFSGYWVKEICNYLIAALKTKEAIAPFPDAINLNIAFHQLVKKWLLWGYFVEKNY